MSPDLKLFDTSLYQEQQNSIGLVAEDLAGLYIEAGDKPFTERINIRRLQISGGEITDPVTAKKVPGELNYDTQLSRDESKAAVSFYQDILDGYPLVFWISPSGGSSPYLEGRINVGYRNSSDEMELYGIPTTISPRVLLARALILSEFSDFSLAEIEDPDKLRGVSIPINVPASEIPPWDFLMEIFPLDSPAWEAIKEGIPEKVKEVTLQAVRSIAPELDRMIRRAHSERDFIVAGAYGEMMMEKMGFRLNTSGCPGLSNSQLLGSSLGDRTFGVDAFGNHREVGYWKPGSCRNCGAKTEVGPCSICRGCEKIL